MPLSIRTVVANKDEEYADDVSAIRIAYNELKLENESNQQHLYELRHKLGANEATQRELQATNDSLEELNTTYKATLEQQQRDIQKYCNAIEDYKVRLNDVEIALEQKSKENEHLHDLLLKNKALPILPDEQNETFSGEIDVKPIDNKFESCQHKIEDEAIQHELCNETIEDLKKEIALMKVIITAKESQILEQSQVLESVRIELAECKTNLELLKEPKTNSSAKGNSIFAEVDDHRHMVEQELNIMRNKYANIRQAYKTKQAEISILRSEQLVLFKKYEEDAANIMEEKTELLKMYKNRISDLETSLKELKMANNQEAKEICTDTSYDYYQHLLACKKTEIGKLTLKIEDASINALVEKEAKHDIMKDVIYWRCRTMAKEAQLLKIKHELEVKNVDGALSKHLLKLFDTDTFTNDTNATGK